MTFGGCPSKRRPTSRSVTDAVTPREPDTRRLPLRRASNVLAVDPHRGHGCRSLGATLSASSNDRPQLPQTTSDMMAILVVRTVGQLSGRGKCLTIFRSGATVGSSSPAAVRSPLHIARCGARSNRRSQATVRSPLLKPLPGCLFVRRHVRETDNRVGLRFGPTPGAYPTVHRRSNHHAATAVRLSEVDASGDALSAPIHHEQQRHRRSEWAGVSWPTDDAHERDAAGVIGFALVRKTAGAPRTARTRRFARSFVPWRGRSHASASSWN